MFLFILLFDLFNKKQIISQFIPLALTLKGFKSNLSKFKDTFTKQLQKTLFRLLFVSSAGTHEHTVGSAEQGSG